MAIKEKILIRRYRGSEESAADKYRLDATKLANEGYYPTGQTWAPGHYGCAAFLIALALCLILIGFLIFIYMLLVKPDGILTVTYELRVAPVVAPQVQEKICPRCAETVKEAAKVCRYCGNEFT